MKVGFNEEDVIRLERNDVMIVRWMCNVSLEEMISPEELRARLKLKNVRECLQHRRMEWFGLLERKEQSVWSSKGKAFKVSESFPRGRPSKSKMYKSKNIKIQKRLLFTEKNKLWKNLLKTAVNKCPTTMKNKWVKQAQSSRKYAQLKKCNNNNRKMATSTK